MDESGLVDENMDPRLVASSLEVKLEPVPDGMLSSGIYPGIQPYSGPLPPYPPTLDYPGAIPYSAPPRLNESVKDESSAPGPTGDRGDNGDFEGKLEPADSAEKGTPPKKFKHKIGEFFCPDCEYVCKRNDKLKLHIQTKHEGLRFPCEYCEYAALRPDKLRDHRRKKHGIETTYPCDVCEFVGENYRSLQIHLKEHPARTGVSKKPGIYGCDSCNFTTNRPFKLQEHIEKKHMMRVLNCTECEFVGETGQQLIEHKEVIHKIKQYPCDDCDYVAKRPDHLKNHQRRIHGKVVTTTWRRGGGGGKPIDDEDLEDMEEIDPSFWLFHQSDVKSEEGDKEEKKPKVQVLEKDRPEVRQFYEKELQFFKVEDDKKVDPTYSVSGGIKKIGKMKKRKTNGPVVSCDVEGCEYTCSRNDKLRFHKRSVHEGIRFKCDLCEYQGTRPDKLKMHKKRKHENPQPRKVRTVKYVEGQKKACDKCDYTADKARNLRAHMIRNHGDAVYHCDQCDYVATFEYNLKNHHDRMHSGKLLTCEKCSYSTRDANRMKYHGQSKHEERRFPCQLCDYVGSVLCELKRHVKRKHGNDKFKCDMCDYVGRRLDHLRDHKKRIHENARNGLSPIKSAVAHAVKSQVTTPNPGLEPARNDQLLDYSRSHQSPFVEQKPPSVTAATAEHIPPPSHTAAIEPKPLNYPNYMLSGHHFLVDHLPRTELRNDMIRYEHFPMRTDHFAGRVDPMYRPEGLHRNELTESDLRNFYLQRNDLHARANIPDNSLPIDHSMPRVGPVDHSMASNGPIDHSMPRVNNSSPRNHPQPPRPDLPMAGHLGYRSDLTIPRPELMQPRLDHQRIDHKVDYGQPGQLSIPRTDESRPEMSHMDRIFHQVHYN